jgi:hypothetical protein
MDMLKSLAKCVAVLLYYISFPSPALTSSPAFHHEALRTSRPGGDFSYYLCPSSSER